MGGHSGNESEIKFEREGLHGIVAKGSYLSDAARRFGVKAVGKCDLSANEHFCEVEILSGADLLSPRTSAESEYFGDREDSAVSRLACQTKIEKAGEVEIMTKEAKSEETAKDAKQDSASESDYLKSFAELPLDKKMAELIKLEAMALGDTLAYIANAPYTIADKAMDLLAGFGFKMHEQEKEAKRPKEHKAKRSHKNGKKEPEASENTSEV